MRARMPAPAGVLGVVCAASLLAAQEGRSAPPSSGAPTLDDYRHFRAAAIDLLGRMPTRPEIEGFERADFDLDRWIVEHTRGPAYVERMTRVYLDVLRLEPNTSLVFAPGPTELLRHDVLGPGGAPVAVFYRANQRRERPETDQEFCLSPDEMGVVVRRGAPDVGTAKPVTAALLERYTVLVKPWWLYRDYLEPAPRLRYGEGWSEPDPAFRPVEALLTEDGTAGGAPIEQVRVCREEASARAYGHVFASGRTKSASAEGRLPGGRLRPPPPDRPFAVAHRGELVACDTKLAFENVPECGCGPGLERCLPGDRNDGGAAAFYFPNRSPIGPGEPLDEARQQAQRWFPYWWSQEAARFLGDLFGEDRDFREILTSRRTFVNGPLAQFYGKVQRSGCCGPEVALGMAEESEPLFDPGKVPGELAPQDASAWREVPDRGPRAAGILTMPMFLEKYASARARAAALYTTFLCKSFVADNQQLAPSAEPDLTVRPGCRTCHATLEPLAAYFARVEPSSFVFLPEALFPVHSARCKRDGQGKLNGPCNALYDVAFADAKGATLRSAYASPEHADATPVGAAADIVARPDFAACAVQRVAGSFLGRPLTPDDDPLLRAWTDAFVRSGYRIRSLVHAVMRSNLYRGANNARSGMAPAERGGER
ncbi:MAG: DUF1585 domain-containing protein [Myxococcales bacterium]|nr:DUF1585 domain-containing protein [Myxococcales bacterium]